MTVILVKISESGALVSHSGPFSYILVNLVKQEYFLYDNGVASKPMIFLVKDSKILTPGILK